MISGALSQRQGETMSGQGEVELGKPVESDQAAGVMITGTQLFDDSVMLRVSGSLDAVGAEDLGGALADELRLRHNVMLDLGRVESIDSHGNEVLLQAVREFCFHDLELTLYRSLRPQVRKALMFSGLMTLLQPVY
jgi:anti-anti-sigma factor